MGVAAAAAAVCVLGAAGWWLWLPSSIRGRIEEAAAARGLRVTVGSVDVSFASLVLHDLEVGAEDDSFRLLASTAATDAGLWDLVLGGTGAVRELTLRGVGVDVDLESPGLVQMLARLRRDGPEDSSGDSGSGGRAVRIQDLTVGLRDREGVFLRVEGGRIALGSDGILRVASGPVEVAPGEDDGVRVEQVSARFRRTGGGLEISAFTAEGVALRYLEREGEAESPLWARARRHVHLLESQREESSRGRSSGANREAGLGAMIGRAREVLGSRLAAGAVLRVENLSVVSSTEGGSRTVLRQLEAEVRALEEGKFRLTGTGRPGRGGRVGWRMVVSPDELRAEGRLDLQRLPFVLIIPFLPDLPWHEPEDTRLSGELSIEGRGATRVHLDGELAIDNLALSSARIAPHPVRRIALELAGQADWDPSTRRLDVSSATVGVGEARVSLSGALEWPADHYLIDVRATLPPTDCDSAIGAIPADLLAELGAFTFSGRIGGRVEAHIDSRNFDATSLAIHIADGCRFETAPALADVRRFDAPFRHRVVEPEGPPFEMETGPGTASWVPIREISPFFIHAVLGHEDGGFFRHSGFSTASIEQALIRNLRAGRYVYGASTITMQLVKNVFLHREKTLARKVQEVLLTWWVENVMPKEQILELYLNVIEYGPAVYGIRHAAEHYFGVAPAHLGPAESAYLASILPNPKAYHSHWVEDGVPERFKRRVARFLQSLGARERYDAEAVAYGLERLQSLDFHHPGDPPPAPREHRGATAPLPFGPSLDRQWEEALGPDAPTEEETGEF